MVRLSSRKSPLINASRVASKKKSLGQGMTEYIIIVGVIAVAAIGAFGSFGDVVEQQTAGMAAELAGRNGKAQIEAAVESAGTASDRANRLNDLSNYDDNGSGVDGE